MYLEINKCNQVFRVKYIVILVVTLFLALFMAGCKTPQPGNQIAQQNQNSQQNTNAQPAISEENEICERGFDCICPGDKDDPDTAILRKSSACNRVAGCKCEKITGADKPILITGGSFQWKAEEDAESFEKWVSNDNGYELLYPGSDAPKRRITEVIIGRGFKKPEPQINIERADDFEEYSRYSGFPAAAKVKVSFKYQQGAGTKENWISTYPDKTVLVLRSGGEKFINYDEKDPPSNPKLLKENGTEVVQILLISTTKINEVDSDGQIIQRYPKETEILHSPIPNNQFMVRVRFNE